MRTASWCLSTGCLPDPQPGSTRGYPLKEQAKASRILTASYQGKPNPIWATSQGKPNPAWATSPRAGSSHQGISQKAARGHRRADCFRSQHGGIFSFEHPRAEHTTSPRSAWGLGACALRVSARRGRCHSLQNPLQPAASTREPFGSCGHQAETQLPADRSCRRIFHSFRLSISNFSGLGK